MKDLEEFFERLSKSKFRSSFKLKFADIEYINKERSQTIEQRKNN
jgi:hypothetical protein